MPHAPAWQIPPKRFDFVSECLKLCQYRSTKSLILSAPEFAFEIVTPCRIRYNTGTIWTQAYNEMPAVSSFCAYFGRCQREGEQDHGKKDYDQFADELIAAVGGKENIVSVTNCMTRLRFVLADESIVKDDEVKKSKA